MRVRSHPKTALDHVSTLQPKAWQEVYQDWHVDVSNIHLEMTRFHANRPCAKWQA